MDLDPAAAEAAIAAAKAAAWAKCTHEDIGQCWQECNDIEAAVLAAAPLIARATADAVADKIKATETALAVIYDPVREPARLSAARYTLGCAAEIARSFGRTPETETTEATE